MPARATCILLACALLVSVCASRARAESTGVSLHAPSECGSEQALRERLVALVGSDDEALARSAHADVTIAEEAGEHRLVMALPSGARELRDHDCRMLLEAAAVILTLELSNPAIETQAHEITPTPTVRTDRPEVPEPVRSALPVHAHGGVEAAGTYGLMPGFGAALGLGAGLHFGRLGTRLSAHYLTPSETPGAPAVRVQGVQAALLLSVTPLARLELAAGARVAFLHGRGTHVDRVQADWLVPWSAVFEARGALLERPRNQLGIVASLGLSLLRPHFRVSGHGSVHQPGPLQAALGLCWERDFF